MSTLYPKNPPFSLKNEGSPPIIELFTPRHTPQSAFFAQKSLSLPHIQRNSADPKTPRTHPKIPRKSPPGPTLALAHTTSLRTQTNTYPRTYKQYPVLSALWKLAADTCQFGVSPFFSVPFLAFCPAISAARPPPNPNFSVP